MANETGDLLDGLTSLGCAVQTSEGTTFVSLPDEYAEFVFDRQGQWLYLGTTFMTPEEIADSEHAGILDHFLLELQDRSLGCHFAYDRNGFLTIGTELLHNRLSPTDVLHIMDQIAFVIEVCIPVCDKILETGRLPSDKEIDAAFGMGERLH